MAKNNDTDFIYNEAKIADARDVLADIKHDLVDIDYLLYDAIVKITGASGIDDVLKDDYSIDLTNPEKQMDQSRSQLKEIMDTLDKQVDSIQKFLNKNQDSTEVKKPEEINKTPDNIDPEKNNTEVTYTKEQLLGEDVAEEVVEDVAEAGGVATDAILDNKEEINPQVNTPTKGISINTEIKNTRVIYGPPELLKVYDPETGTYTVSDEELQRIKEEIRIKRNTVPTSPETISPVVDSEPVNPVVNPAPSTPSVNPTPVVNPEPVTNPEPVANPEPVSSTTTTTEGTSTTSNVSSEKIKTSTSIKSTSPISSTTKYVSTSDINSANRSTDDSVSTANRVNTSSKSQISEANTTTRSNLDPKVVGGAAAAGAALLGALGIGVAASSKKKNQEEEDENFSNNQTYYQTDENYNNQ